MNRELAWGIVQKHVQSVGLRGHMLAVEGAVRWYARHLGADEDLWGLAGLLHDYDWEIHPDLHRHPLEGIPLLRQEGCPEPVIQAILSHNTEGTGVPRQSDLDFALLACDEITGLISAASLIHPSKDIRVLKLKSIKKRWKSKAFAAGVDRDHVESVTEDFSQQCFSGTLSLWQHVQNVVEAMTEIAESLALDGSRAQ